jgi:hypothetical protein
MLGAIVVRFRPAAERYEARSPDAVQREAVHR